MYSQIGLFVDISNIYYCVKKQFDGAKVDYNKYLDVVKCNNSKIISATAYGAQMDGEATKFLVCLEALGFKVKYKKPKEYTIIDYNQNFRPLEIAVNNLPKTWDKWESASRCLEKIKLLFNQKNIVRKADWDVGICIDIIRTLLTPYSKINTIVIGSADGDLVPLIEWIKEYNNSINVIIYACNISKELKNIADSIIEINETILIRDN